MAGIFTEKRWSFFINIVSFFTNKGEKRNVNLKSLVILPLVKYTKIVGETGDLCKHSKNVYHINAIQINDF